VCIAPQRDQPAGFRARRAPAGAEVNSFAGAGPADGDESAWLAAWGWDLCAPGGLCERAYEHLGLPPSGWPALKALPEVSPRFRSRSGLAADPFATNYQRCSSPKSLLAVQQVESERKRRAGGQVAGGTPLEHFAGAYLPALGIDAPAPAPAAPTGHAAPATGREATAASAAGAAASLARSEGVAPCSRPPPVQLDAGALGPPDGPAGGAGAGAADEPDQAAALEAEARRWDLAREQLAHGEAPPAACGAASPDPNPGLDPGAAAGDAREEHGATAASGAGGTADQEPAQARGGGQRPDDLRSASSLARGAALGGGRAADANTTAAALGAVQARPGAAEFHAGWLSAMLESCRASAPPVSVCRMSGLLRRTRVPRSLSACPVPLLVPRLCAG